MRLIGSMKKSRIRTTAQEIVKNVYKNPKKIVKQWGFFDVKLWCIFSVDIDYKSDKRIDLFTKKVDRNGNTGKDVTFAFYLLTEVEEREQVDIQ